MGKNTKDRHPGLCEIKNPQSHRGNGKQKTHSTHKKVEFEGNPRQWKRAEEIKAHGPTARERYTEDFF